MRATESALDPSPGMNTIIFSLAVALLWSACGVDSSTPMASVGGGAGGLVPGPVNGTGAGGGGAAGGGSSATGPLTVYRADQYKKWRTDPITQSTDLVWVTRYQVARLGDTGFAFVGPEADVLDATPCAGPLMDGQTPVCVSWSLSAGTLTLAGSSHTFTTAADHVMFDGDRWERLPPEQSVPSGNFNLTSFFGALVTTQPLAAGSTLILRPDGTFTASRTKYSLKALDTGFWAGCVINTDCTISGRFRLAGPHSLELEGPAGTKVRRFFRNESANVVQIGGERFTRP